MTENTTASGAADLMRNALRETAAVLVLEDAFPDLLQMVESALAASAPVAPAPITDAEQAAWFAGLDEGRSQVRALLQQGEYLPLPAPNHRGPCGTGSYFDAYTAEQMRAYVDADRAARGAAQAAQFLYAIQGPDGKAHLDEQCVSTIKGDFGDTVFYLNDETFTGPYREVAVYLTPPAPVAEDAEIRKALHDAATSLETISRIAGKDPYMLEMVDVRIYAAARAKVAREAQAAQPEGGEKP